MARTESIVLPGGKIIEMALPDNVREAENTIWSNILSAASGEFAGQKQAEDK